MFPSVSLMAALLAGPLPIDPPWHAPPPGKLDVTISGMENAPDFHGNPANPDLALLIGGNQFMAMPDLVAAFQKLHPELASVFYETLPPGVLAQQLENGGSIRVGNLTLRIDADVFASGKGRMEKERAKGLVGEAITYAQNDLAIMVPRGNPKGIHGLADLAAAGLRLSLPNPKLEGIGEQIGKALEAAGGAKLRHRIMEEKVSDGTTVLTRIHHRQTPIAILRGKADAGVVWRTEVLFQRALGHPIDLIEIPAGQNALGTYQAAVAATAPHRAAAQAFVEFLATPGAQAIFGKYGFAPPPK